ERHVLSINELTSMLSVSHMTVRRDIQALENDGKVLSVTGGVRLAARLKSEPSYLAKAQLEVPAKRAIAREAAGLVREDFTGYLGAEGLPHQACGLPCDGPLRRYFQLEIGRANV